MPKIECPICEAVFVIDKSTRQNQSVVCPECDEGFPATRERLVQPQKPTATALQQATPTIQDSAEVATDKNDEAVRPTRGGLNGDTMANTDLPTSKEDSANVFESGHNSVAVNEQKSIHTRIAHNRNRNLFPLFIIGVLALASIGLVFVLLHVMNNGPTVAQPENPIVQPVDKLASDPKPKEPKRRKRVWQPNELAGSNNFESPIPNDTQSDLYAEPPTSTVPLLVSSSSFWPKSKLETQWREYHPHLVRLIVETPTGKHEAIGTVVDSRGWIATSLRAVSGAARIRVKQISNRLDQIGETELLDDLVRGVIASDAEADLAILSINRRFVISFGNVQFAKDDRLVGSQRIAVPFFPDANSAMVVREHKITGRKTFVQFKNADQIKLAEKGLDDKLIEWVEFQSVENEGMPNKAIAGAPLINEDGEFAAMSSNAMNGEDRLATPVIHLANLLATATNNVLPLSILNEDLAKLGIETIDPNTVVSDEHPLKQLSLQINRTGEACDKFNWQPTSSAEYKSLQDLLRQIVEMQTFLNSDPDNTEAEKSKEQIDHWYSRIDVGIAGGYSKELVTQINELAVESLNSRKQDFFLAFATVKFSAFDGPKMDNADAITLELVGKGDFISVPFSPELPRMLPGSTWLLACYPPKNNVINFTFNGYSHKTRPTSLVFVNGPVD